jgi:hypothetical protein
MAMTEQPQRAEHLVDLGRNAPRNLGRPLVKLTAKQRLLVEYMVYGAPLALKARYPNGLADKLGQPINLFEPLSLDQAADLLGIRRRNARRLRVHSTFEGELLRAVSALRTNPDIGSRPNVNVATAPSYVIDLSEPEPVTIEGSANLPGEPGEASPEIRRAASAALLGGDYACEAPLGAPLGATDDSLGAIMFALGGAKVTP